MDLSILSRGALALLVCTAALAVAAEPRRLRRRPALNKLPMAGSPRSSATSPQLIRLSPDDPIVQSLAEQLITASREKRSDVPALATALRQHVADSYRIHQRLIRSRRADAAGWEFRPRGPTFDEDEEPPTPHVREEVVDDPVMADLLSGLEDWRTAATTAIAQGMADEAMLATRYVSLLEATGISCGASYRWGTRWQGARLPRSGSNRRQNEPGDR